MRQQKTILITNDDGIISKGIKSLIEVAKDFGRVVVVAPDKPQSGMGHAITVNQPLRLYPNHLFEGVEAYASTGTPVDCVKLGIYEVLKGKPDLILSGINHGENTSTNVLYSGTMSAAVEGAMEGIPSLGFSLADFDEEADFSLAKEVVTKMLEFIETNKMPLHTCYNVNIPKINKTDFKGVKFAKQAYAFWEDRFDKRLDQFKKPYYWMTGDFKNLDSSEDTDLWALKNGYASIVPTQFDMTDYTELNKRLKTIL
jgi:5'-nucleotidase